MREKEKASKGLLYDANNDIELVEERKICKDLCYQYNQLMPSDGNGHLAILHKLFAKINGEIEIMQPFWCDYGYHIYMGDQVFINHNCVMLDCADIHFGNHIFIGPNCGFYTAGHPLNAEKRNAGLEYAYPIIIEDDVWIGANVSVLAGVTIGKGSVIAAGSIVNKDIPPHVVAGGNPCKVIKQIE